MRFLVAAVAVFLALVVFPAAADKPGWAGQSGRPSEEEIQQHREQMREKNDDKPQAGRQNAQGQQGEDDADGDGTQKKKAKQKDKAKQNQGSTFEQRYGNGGDKDQDQDREREHQGR